MTTVDDQIIARGRRRLLPPGEHTEWDQQNAARAALDVITAGIAEQDDAELAIYREMAMPAWNEPSGRWPVVEAGPLLGLMEESTT
jgi:hypothetical protein